MSDMTAPSPDELALLRLMAEVGVPLRFGRRWSRSWPSYGSYFPGHQTVPVPAHTADLVPGLLLGQLIERDTAPVAPPDCLDYVLTDKGRTAASSGD